MIDRKTPPKIYNVTGVAIPDVERYTLDNGIKVIEVNMGTQDIIKVEVLYDASRPIEDKELASRMTASLQKESTTNFTSEEMAERIDYYGASMSSGANMDYTYFSIFVLNKYFGQALPLFAEVLHEATFAQEEIDKYREIQLENLKSNLAKSDLVAFRKITEEIFGTHHAYGYNSTEANIKALTRDDLWHHYHSYHTSDRCQIIVSGKVDGSIRKLINQYLGQVKTVSKPQIYKEPIINLDRQVFNIKSDQTHQTAIKIGRRMFNRNHPDFAASFMLNTILGGYFGSRLMESIREDLGYTYNVYSSLDPLVHDGYMTVSTEVSNDLVEPTVAEIYHQMEILQQDKVDDEEMEMVRNYVMGNFLNMVDGPFRVASLMKSLCISGMDIPSYQQIISDIYHCTADQIRDQAQQYFKKEHLIEVKVGSQY